MAIFVQACFPKMKPYSRCSFILPYNEKPHTLCSFVLRNLC